MSNQVKYLADFEQWGDASTSFERRDGAVWDSGLIKSVLGTDWDWTQLVLRAEGQWKAPYILRVIVCKEGDLYVFGKKDDESFVIGYKENDSKDVNIGTLSYYEARIVDQYLFADNWHKNAGPWAKWGIDTVIGVARFFGVGKNYMETPKFHTSG